MTAEQTNTLQGLKEFNINHYVLVKLKDEGYRYWKSNDDRFLPHADQWPIERYKNKADANGMVEFQMWDFMRMFGGTIHMGFNLMFETTVYFKERNLVTPKT